MRLIVTIMARVTLAGLGIAAGYIAAEIGYRYLLFGSQLSYAASGACYQAPADKPFVAFFGDSFAAGYPFRIHDSFPVLLEQRLQRPDVRLVNCARSRNNLSDQVNDMRILVSRRRTRLAVWAISTFGAAETADQLKGGGFNSPGYDPHDWTPPEPAPKRVPPPPSMAKKWRDHFHAVGVLIQDCLASGMSPFSTLKEVLLDFTYVYGPIKSFVEEQGSASWLRANVANRPEQREASNAFLTIYRTGTRSLPAFQAIDIANDQLSARGIPLVLVYLPQESDVNDNLFRANIAGRGERLENYDRQNPRALIRDFCVARNIAFVDPSDAMAAEVLRGRRFFMSFDRHYTRSGQAWLADYLARDRTLAGMLDRVSGPPGPASK